MSLVNARPPLMPTADHCRRPATPIPNELRLSVFVALTRGTAPAWRNAYASGFCVMLGSASIISAPTAPETLVRSVWSSGASAETSTVSPSAFTDSSTATRTVSVALRTMPLRLKGANPASVTVTE
jgi:hypothetical protein